VVANTFFETKVEQLVDLARLFGSALEQAGLKIPRGRGLLVFIHVDQVDPLAGRLTRDIDVAIDRRDLERSGLRWTLFLALRRCGAKPAFC